MLRIALRVRLRASPPLRMTDRVQRAEWSVGEGLAPPVIKCRVQNAECRVGYAELPLALGEVAGAKRVTERGFEEIEVAPKVTERDRDKFRVQS